MIYDLYYGIVHNSCTASYETWAKPSELPLDSQKLITKILDSKINLVTAKNNH